MATAVAFTMTSGARSVLLLDTISRMPHSCVENNFCGPMLMIVVARDL